MSASTRRPRALPSRTIRFGRLALAHVGEILTVERHAARCEVRVLFACEHLGTQPRRALSTGASRAR